MASSKSHPRVPEDLAPDPGLTYNPARTAVLGRVEEARPVAEGLLARDWTHQGFRQLCREHGIGDAE